MLYHIVILVSILTNSVFVCALELVKLAVLLPSDTKFPFTIYKVKPAIDIAIDFINASHILPNHALQTYVRDSNCSETYGPLRAFDLYMKGEVNVFIGPFCDYAVAPIGRFAPHWSLPVITAGAPVKAFDNKALYKTLTRIHDTYGKNADFLWEITRIFNWSTIGLLFSDFTNPDEGKSNFFFALEPIFHMFKNRGYEPKHKTFDERYATDAAYENLLTELSLGARVIVLCASADSVRDILIKAHELGFDNGEYVFLNIDLFSSKDESEKPWHRPGEDERNRKAKKAYEALMTVTLRKPTSKEYKNFSMEVKRRAKENNVNFTYGEEEVNSFVGAFHDAVILYALALNETLAANKSITDGAEITKRMWNRTFEGITGNVSIDDNGDRNADYSLLDMDPKTHKFHVVANYFGKDKEYKPVAGKSIHWAGGRTSPPPDTPKCGFDRSKCPPDKPFPEYGIVIIVLGSLLVIVLVAAFFIYRHVKLEAELAEMNWRVKWEDIMFGTMENEKKLRRQGSTLSLNRTNGDACAEGRVLIERSDPIDQSWCKCGECAEGDRIQRVCCRQLELFGIIKEGTNCITTTEDFRNIVLNKEVLLAVYIHVMLVRRQRGTAPDDLSACKFRSMATRQFLCWMHRGQKLKKESRMSIPSCVARAIRAKFPDATTDFSSTSRGSCTTSTLAETMPAEKPSLASSCSRDTIAVHLSDVGQRQLFTKTGYYKGAIVAIKSIDRQLSMPIPKPLLLEIKRIKDLQNDHIVRFLGACIDPPNMCIITEYCQKGSLQDVLENEQIKLDWMFRYSLMQDILRGLSYLHSSEIRSHGNLKSTNCVVDGRFVLKITDFGLHAMRSKQDDQNLSHAYYQSLLWTAPELLRMHNRPPEGTSKGDVYSFGIICQEIVYRSGVFYLENLDVEPEEIYKKVKNGLKPYFRPTLDENDCPCDELAEVIRECWREDPMERPDFLKLKSVIRKLNKDGDKGNILDNLLSRMEQYANNLEALVEERTADYLEQKKKAEDLLYMMLPKSIAQHLIRGETVLAENFDAVTIYFSDICGFTALSSESTPFQVVDLLNDLYTTFDTILEKFDVYKVETIGDAYMVVSGLPNRNGNLHAREIARMSLTLLNAVLSFKIRHRPNEQLKLRIGIHSGSVCAGVVGLKMPRYCLFGDTVNTASRMESNGLPLRIHVSPFTKEILDNFGTFDLDLRGPVEMKGKGKLTTWWLTGERVVPNPDRESVC